MNEIRYLELDTFELSGTSTNIVNNSLNVEFSVYPNPAKNNLTLDFYSDNYEKTTFTLNDILGKRIQDYTFCQLLMMKPLILFLLNLNLSPD